MTSSDILEISGPLVLASHNANKLAALKEALLECPVQILTARELGIRSPDETGTTVLENALIKARAVADETGHAAISDDSGFCITALDDLPGAAALDWAGPDGDHTPALNRIGDMLQGRGISSSPARYVTAIAVALPCGSAIAEEGATEGQLVWPPRGQTEGYLSVFALDGDAQTIAEKMGGEDTSATHNIEAYAHRRPTIEKLIRRLHFAD
ncbi:non-canonical purine NTP pyrophosphatase [Roseibium sp.]|uniref:non-canonical purine NTP pyrophosphatase n=1 Tax=Roseibium sp. TaxID=1936156 RepID=UPI003B52B1DF